MPTHRPDDRGHQDDVGNAPASQTRPRVRRTAWSPKLHALPVAVSNAQYTSQSERLPPRPRGIRQWHRRPARWAAAQTVSAQQVIGHRAVPCPSRSGRRPAAPRWRTPRRQHPASGPHCATHQVNRHRWRVPPTDKRTDAGPVTGAAAAQHQVTFRTGCSEPANAVAVVRVYRAEPEVVCPVALAGFATELRGAHSPNGASSMRQVTTTLRLPITS